jgi:hypothetical protein
MADPLIHHPRWLDAPLFHFAFKSAVNSLDLRHVKVR